MRTKIAGVVTLFHPPESICENVQTYLHDLDILYVFDNSPGTYNHLIEALKQFKKVQYISMGRNVGVATALNTAAKIALEHRFKYLLTMDQDSRISPGMIDKMLAVAKEHPLSGIISPLHLVENDIRPSPNQETEQVLTAMTSGNLLNLSLFEKIGGFDEKLFIDYVDHEYCLRLQQHDYSVIRINTAMLYHKVGNLQERKIFWKIIHPPDHHPVRYFYQTRNRFYLRRIYGKQFAEFFRIDGKAYWRGVAKMILFENNRTKKIIMIFRGFVAFFRNDFSSIPA